MTNLEAIRANISDAHGVVLSENHFVKALVDVGLVPSGTYTSERSVDRATLKLYDQILLGANLSEGSLSYSVDLQGVRSAKEALEARLGIKDLKNKVTTARPW